MGLGFLAFPAAVSHFGEMVAGGYPETSLIRFHLLGMARASCVKPYLLFSASLAAVVSHFIDCLWVPILGIRGKY